MNACTLVSRGISGWMTGMLLKAPAPQLCVFFVSHSNETLFQTVAGVDKAPRDPAAQGGPLQRTEY